MIFNPNVMAAAGGGGGNIVTGSFTVASSTTLNFDKKVAGILFFSASCSAEWGWGSAHVVAVTHSNGSSVTAKVIGTVSSSDQKSVTFTFYTYGYTVVGQTFYYIAFLQD